MKFHVGQTVTVSAPSLLSGGSPLVYQALVSGMVLAGRHLILELLHGTQRVDVPCEWVVREETE